jgi:hypothetical protein
MTFYRLLVSTSLRNENVDFTDRKVAVNYIRNNWPHLDIHQDEDPADNSWLSVFRDNVVPQRGADTAPFIYGMGCRLNLLEAGDV